MTRAVDSPTGLPSRPVSASWMLGLLMPEEVSRSLMTTADRGSGRISSRQARLVEGVLQGGLVTLAGVGGAGDRVDVRAARFQGLGVQGGDRVRVDLLVEREG